MHLLLKKEKNEYVEALAKSLLFCGLNEAARNWQTGRFPSHDRGTASADTRGQRWGSSQEQQRTLRGGLSVACGAPALLRTLGLQPCVTTGPGVGVACRTAAHPSWLQKGLWLPRNSPTRPSPTLYEAFRRLPGGSLHCVLSQRRLFCDAEGSHRVQSEGSLETCKMLLLAT